MVAESLLVKHQLLILNRPRKRAPNLRPSDRLLAGLCAGFMHPTRLMRSAIVLKPSTILDFHRALVRRKYRLLFSPSRLGKPGPKGPSSELITAIVEMKRRNPRFGCRWIAQQISFVFGIEIDKDVVRRLWSVDLFRCESLILKAHWVMVVMDQFTRRIIGFGAHAGVVDGPAACRIFNNAIRGDETPRYLSSDHDPLFEFRRFKANLRILEIMEVKTVPYAPLSHPFLERLIGTIRREFLDQVPFWAACDLETKLLSFKDYYNDQRSHHALGGVTPHSMSGKMQPKVPNLNGFRWRSHCRGLSQPPVAA